MSRLQLLRYPRLEVLSVSLFDAAEGQARGVGEAGSSGTQRQPEKRSLLSEEIKPEEMQLSRSGGTEPERQVFACLTSQDKRKTFSAFMISNLKKERKSIGAR